MGGIPLECAWAHERARVWGPQIFELAIPANSFANINTPLSMEEAAEPEQGVLGITKLIWGQTEDTCALEHRQGLRTHAVPMRGGRLGFG